MAPSLISIKYYFSSYKRGLRKIDIHDFHEKLKVIRNRHLHISSYFLYCVNLSYTNNVLVFSMINPIVF